MTDQHTPAPWTVQPMDSYWRINAANPRGRIVTLAEVRPRPVGFGEANARLIAAAPDLLAALEAFTQAPIIFDAGDFDAIAAVQLQARAALAKARGEAVTS